MKKILFAALAMLFAAVQPSKAQIAEERYPSYVDVSGYAEREVAPDTFTLSIVIDEKDSNGKNPVDKQERRMVRALYSIGIDPEKQLAISDMSGSYYKKNNSLITAYYRLTLNSSEDVSRTMAALDDIGISNVSIQSVSHSDLKSIRDEIRVEAIGNARERASMLAAAVGQEIGSCIRISDYSGDGVNESFAVYNLHARKTLAGDMMAETADDIDEPLEFKPMKIVCSISARFILKTELYESPYTRKNRQQ